VPHPWPSREQLTSLVEKSEGLFIYVSTLVKFVGDRRGLPQEKLQLAMTAHYGVDPLYEQVLSQAQAWSAQFHRVLGTIIYLQHPLCLHDLGQLLQLSSNHIRQALDGCQSVLVLPDSDQDSILPYHASLKDFLTNVNRAKGHFLDPMIYHVMILVDCLELIGQVHEDKRGQPLGYACQQWCYHLSLAFSHRVTIGWMKRWGDIEMLMGKMKRQWLKTWMYGLERKGLQKVCQDCESVLEQIEQGEWKESINQIQEVTKDVCNFI